MNKEDKYIVTIGALTILLFITVIIIFINFKIMEDLNYMIDVHKNTIGVCNVDLKQVQKENEELRADLEKRCEKQDK